MYVYMHVCIFIMIHFYDSKENNMQLFYVG